ncbi:putative ankyrin repeat protein RF_0381 [Haliotis cracherodii]|uniref:putative ankyrin repeat protein RF_0381 n=1 Tax=Haliotis cracherodii TaxID=6455 RepID=UPI0039E8A32F
MISLSSGANKKAATAEAETERLITGANKKAATAEAETERLITGANKKAATAEAETERLITATSGEVIEEYEILEGSKRKPIADTEFHKACDEGDLVCVKRLMNNESLDVNAPGSYGVTPVMWATQKGHYDVFKCLVDNGADISCLDIFEDNMLNMACIGQNINILRYILTTDPAPDINRPRKDGRTPLMWAALQGNVDVFDYLKSKQADCLAMDNDGDNILHYACLGGHIEMVSHIISENIIDINRSDRYGRTALMEAAKYGHKLVFDFLLSKGGDISHKDKEGNNIFHVACREGDLEMVGRILSQGEFDINCRGQNGKTPLLFAAFGGHRWVFDLLVRKKANASIVGSKGNNILHVACIGGHVGMVEHILSQSMVDINSQGEDGFTSLMLAARSGRRAVFGFLVNKGANLFQVDKKGNNILHVACKIGSIDIVQDVLSQHRLDINARNSRGETASMIAKRKHHMDVFNLLVKM